jgi:alpha-glucosidase
MCYPFEMLQPARLTAGLLSTTFARMARAAPDAWPCWAYSNHDVIRHATRWGLDDAGVRAYAVLLVTLRGSLCLYQGEELGLPEADVAFEDLQDPYGIEFWPEFKGRDGCRTPMPWEPSNRSGGFSDGKPWLPVPPEHLHRAAAGQAGVDGSMLEHYRRALAFRRAQPVLVTGDMSAVTAAGDVATFTRADADGRVWAAFNLGHGTATVALPPGDWAPVGADLGAVAPVGGAVTLGPWEFALLRGAAAMAVA